MSKHSEIIIICVYGGLIAVLILMGAHKANAAWTTSGNDDYQNTGNVIVGGTSPEERFDVIGNAKFRDSATESKAYRFRTNGGALDFEAGGANMHFSIWSNGDFSGSQYQIFRFQSNGGPVLFERGVVFNENASNDQDLQIKGDTDDHLFFADVSSDRVGIGTNNPATTLDVDGDVTINLTDCNLAVDATGKVICSTGGTTGSAEDPARDLFYGIILFFISMTFIIWFFRKQN